MPIELKATAVTHAHIKRILHPRLGVEVEGRSCVRYLRFRRRVRLDHLEVPRVLAGRWEPAVPTHPAHVVVSVLEDGRWRAVKDVEFPPDPRISGEGRSPDAVPAELNKLLHYPRIRFAMAHISWPWCEECLAVMGRMKAAGNPHGQSYVDITLGAPPHIRKQAIANAIAFCGPERLMFGSDDGLPGDLSYQKTRIDGDLKILDELGLDASQKERIFAGTADELFPAGSSGSSKGGTKGRVP